MPSMKFASALFLLTCASAQNTDKFFVDSVFTYSAPLFADTKIHSSFEKSLYNFGAKFHSTTKPFLIQQLVPFKPGDSVSNQTLSDIERYLRTQPYLAGAKVTLDSSSGKNVVRVTVQDKWSLNPFFALTHPADNWDWGIGLVEYNLAGLGIQTGLTYLDVKDKQGWRGLFGMPNFLLPRQRIDLSYFRYGDGFESYASLGKPLATLSDQWSWSGIYYSKQENKVLYLFNDQEPEWKVLKGNSQKTPVPTDYALPTSISPRHREDSASLYLMRNLNLGQSYFQIIARSDWKLRHAQKSDSTLLYSITDSSKTYFKLSNPHITLPYKEDWWNGFALQLHIPNLKKFANFRKLKHVEDIDLGWKFASGLYQDFKTEDGNNGLKWTTGLDGGFDLDQRWINTFGVRNSYRPNNKGPKEGRMRAWGESQFLILSNQRIASEIHQASNARASFVLSGDLNSLWDAPTGEYLSLGGYDGLMGSPDFAYVGRITGYGQFEMRYFPSLDAEFGTIVPALTVFANGANAWSNWDNIDVNDLNYRIGLGLRLGASKSVQGIINHLNLSWPIGDSKSKGISFNLTAKATL